MGYKYDPKTDTLLIALKSGISDFGRRSGNIITHYNKRGVPIEIEILDAGRTILKMILKGRKLASKN